MAEKLVKINRYLDLDEDSVINVFVAPHFHYDYLWCSNIFS
ncbi:MAG TPA: hypothetical protein VGB37_08285 [Candidatus Lokiarchaeia archaeon]